MPTQPPPHRRAKTFKAKGEPAKAPLKSRAEVRVIRARIAAEVRSRQLPLAGTIEDKVAQTPEPWPNYAPLAPLGARTWRAAWTKFADYQHEGGKWVAFKSANFYPDYLEPAVALYESATARFGVMANAAASSTALLRSILAESTEMRKPMLRIFRRYVAPTAPVEQTKRTGEIEETIAMFGPLFRDIGEVCVAFAARPIRDEALAAILWEHHDRGTPGTKLTKMFFAWVEANLPTMKIRGGRDIPLRDLFDGYPSDRGVDFVITEDDEPIAVGFLHYDSDRGGSQESDRPGGYMDDAEEIGDYLSRSGARTKILFVNDGPGLLLGAMWEKYAAIEEKWPKRILVATMKMLGTRLSIEWLRS